MNTKLIKLTIYLLFSYTVIWGQCPAPANLVISSITDDSALLSWNSVSNATSYDVEWTDSDISNNWTSNNGVTGNTLFLTNLTKCTYYRFRIRSVCNGVKSSFVKSNPFSTTGDCSPDWPTPSSSQTVNCTFGELHASGADHFHGAIDIGRTNGDDYTAVQSGIVDAGGWQNDADNSYIKVNHMNNKQSVYIHINSNLNGGEIVKKGDKLGTIKALGHVHLEFRQIIGNRTFYLNPFDNPLSWHLSKPNDIVKPEITSIIIDPINNNSGFLKLPNLPNTELSIFKNNFLKIKLSVANLLLLSSNRFVI